MTYFMAWVILLSAGIGACAIVAEHVTRARTGSARWIWVASLGAVLLVAGIATFAPPPVRETPITEVQPLIVDGIRSAPITVVGEQDLRAEAILRTADALLPVAWAIASAILLLAILYGQRRLVAERRRSSPAVVGGREVLLTEALGPAVAGITSPVVLLPRWTLALDATAQELLLAHEFEHVKRGDTRLLLTGAVAAALMPWNPVVWWATRRLRLSVELDCDARVLQSHPHVRRYADLLLTAASRTTLSARLFAAHFGEHRSDLDRRIQAMTDKRLKWRPVIVATTAAVALIAMSCEAPRPEPIAPGLEQKSAEPKRLVSSSDVLTESQVEKAVTAAPGFAAPRYPDILRQAGVEGEVLVSFVVDENGNADPTSLEIVRATHELFATAVKNALPAMRFNPAEVGGKKVKQLVQQPFSFSLPGSRVDASHKETATLEVALPDEKRALIVRRQDALTEEPYVVVYAFDGTELARSERDGNLLKKIEPKSIHSIEVFKGSVCGPKCPLIKIVLAKDETLGSLQRIRPTREETPAGSWERKAETRFEGRVDLSAIMAEPHTVELLSSSGEVVARYGSRGEVREINSEDITASETYNGKSCKAGSACPLTRIWLKLGRDAAYRKK